MLRISSAIPALACFALSLLFLGGEPAGAAGRTRHLLDAVQPELKFTDVPLTEALDYIRDTAGIDMIVDWKNLEAANIDRNTLINVHLHHISLRKALSVVLNEAGSGDLLTFYVQDDILNVTTQAQADTMLYTKVYDVQDLLVTIPNFSVQDVSSILQNSNSGGGQTIGGTGGAPSSTSNSNVSALGNSASTTADQTPDQLGQELVKLITDTIRPDAWTENGGKCTIRFYHGLLIVTAPISILQAIGGPVD